MTHKMLRPSMIALTLMAAVASAHAGLIIENSPTSGSIRVSAQGMSMEKSTLNEKSGPVIVNIGKVPPNLRRVFSDMKQKSVGEALAVLAPKGWSGYASDPRIKSVDSVSFSGNGRQWPAVLKEVLQAYGLKATINWTKREISVSVSDSGPR